MHVKRTDREGLNESIEAEVKLAIQLLHRRKNLLAQGISEVIYSRSWLPTPEPQMIYRPVI